MDDFYADRVIARLTKHDVADLCGISPRTITSWEKNQAPVYAKTICRLLSGFPYGNDWQEWRFANKLLWSPEGISFTPFEIRAIPYHHALIAELKRKVRPDITDTEYENVHTLFNEILRAVRQG